METVSDTSVLFLEVTSGNLIPVSSIFVLLIVNSVREKNQKTKKNEQISYVNQLPFTIWNSFSVIFVYFHPFVILISFIWLFIKDWRNSFIENSIHKSTFNFQHIAFFQGKPIEKCVHMVIREREKLLQILSYQN